MSLYSIHDSLAGYQIPIVLPTTCVQTGAIHSNERFRQLAATQPEVVATLRAVLAEYPVPIDLRGRRTASGRRD